MSILIFLGEHKVLTCVLTVAILSLIEIIKREVKSHVNHEPEGKK
jgi:hypothetical protein